MNKAKKYIIYFIALNLIVLGADKFFGLLPVACTLMEDDASINMLYGIGVAEIIFGLVLFTGKYHRTILVLIIVMMTGAIIMHILTDTYDIGAAIFLGVLAGIPLFIKES